MNDDTGALGLDACVEEIPYNGIDEDCDGEDLVDVDGDGFDAARVGGADCDDSAADVNPDAQERCDNLVDDDCDNHTDEGCGVASAGPPDPGGLYWICGATTPTLLHAPFALALVLTLLRRRPRV